MEQFSDQTRSGMPVRRFTLSLAALSAVIWMGTSILVPGLPKLGRDLLMSSSELGTTLTIYYLTSAMIMLLAGPLSDRWGRRIFVMVGLPLFFLGSICCGLAEGSFVFLLGRAVQGIGAGMIQVPTLAMVRDECPGRQSYAVLGLLGALTSIIPVLSMLVGGLITDFWGWRPMFYVLASAASASMLICLSIPETLRQEDRLSSIDLLGSLKGYMNILLSRQVLLVTSALMMLGIFVGGYFILAPVVFESAYGLSPTAFALYNILIVGAMAGGQFASSRAVKKYAPKTLYVAGGLIGLVGSVLFVGLLLASVMNHALCFMLPLMLVGFSLGFMVPIGMGSLFARFAKTSAMASATYVCLMLLMQGFGSVVAGLLMDAGLSGQEAMGTMALSVGLLVALLVLAGKDRILN